MTALIRGAIVLLTIVNSIPKLRPRGLGQLSVIAIAAIIGHAGISVFATASRAEVKLAEKTTALDPKSTFLDNCSACHGENAEGVKDLGVNLTTSDFVKTMSDGDFAAFLKIGRQPTERDSKTKQLMPAFDYLSEDETKVVIAFVRSARR